MILISGASGNAGRAVLHAALELNLPVRAMYRSDQEAAKAPDGVSVVIADFSERESLLRALDGIEQAFVVCGPIPQLVELESNMIDACKTAGVRHIVLNSALGAGRFEKSFPSWHTKVEAKLRETGLGYTILRPNGFMQNILAFNAESIRTDHAFYAAMGEARTSLVDVRDVGAVAAKVLAKPDLHAAKTYELNGPEAVSNADVAERISHIVGRKIAYVDIPEDAQRRAMLDAGKSPLFSSYRNIIAAARARVSMASYQRCWVGRR